MQERKDISLGASALVAIAIIIIIGFTVFFTANITASQATTTYVSSVTGTSSSLVRSTSFSLQSSASPSAVTIETTNASLGLDLLLSVNSTMIPGQDAISMSASILNTLRTTNNLSSANDWAIQGLASGPCDLGDASNKLFSPVGFAVFPGFYQSNNLTAAGRPMPVWAEIECIVDLAFNGTKILGDLYNITSYSLLPQGPNNPGNDSGSYAGYYSPSVITQPTCTSVCSKSTTPTYTKGVFPTKMDSQTTIYAANGTGFFNSLGSSISSNYTLVAGDEWGQIVLLHFKVVTSTNLPVVGNFLAFGGCFENAYPVPCTVETLSQALVFNCAGEAATPAGCTIHGSIGPNHPSFALTNYTITVWYPYVNQTNEPPHDNCMFSVRGDTTSPFGYCFMINSTAFVISI